MCGISLDRRHKHNINNSRMAVKKKRSRSESPVRSRDRDTASTPSAVSGRTPPLVPSDSSVASGGVRSAFIAEAGKNYRLEEIPPGGDFKSGVIRARCTGVDVKDKTSRTNGSSFIVMEVLVTDTVTRMVRGTFPSAEHLPKPLPVVGDFVVVRGVKTEPSTYDAMLYGPTQFAVTRQFTIQSFKVGASDPRIPATWSTTSVRATPTLPKMTVDDFFKDL